MLWLSGGRSFEQAICPGGQPGQRCGPLPTLHPTQCCGRPGHLLSQKPANLKNYERRKKTCYETSEQNLFTRFETKDAAPTCCPTRVCSSSIYPSGSVR